MRKILVLTALFALVAGSAFAVRNTNPTTDGPYRTYYESGALLKEANYKFQELDGVCKDYYEKGALQAITNYVKGSREGVAKTYYESAIVKTEGIYYHNELQGPFKIYNKEGWLERVENYEAGVLSGDVKTYYPSGSIKKQMSYQNAVLNGMALVYSEDGRLIGQEVYKNGALIDKKAFDQTSQLATEKPMPKAITPPANGPIVDPQAKAAARPPEITPADVIAPAPKASEPAPADNKQTDTAGPSSAQ